MKIILTKNPINYIDITNFTFVFNFYELIQDLPEAN